MSDYIYHHGVKGMKWGVRKDKKTSGKNTRSVKTDKPEVSDEKKKAARKKALKISGYVAATVAISAIGTAMTVSPKVRSLMGKGIEAIKGKQDLKDDYNDGKLFNKKTGKYEDLEDVFDYVMKEDGAWEFKRKPGR